MSKQKIINPEPPEGKVWANPTRNFFVKMLTRDIALADAIMDLLDNCIDGVHRQLKNRKTKPKSYIYKGFFADIQLTDQKFSIKDNCGGIPLEVAKQYAFKMGRSDDYHDDDNLETVGMYGIGMKRAIFKIGLKADVTTWHDQNIYSVNIPDNWVEQRGEWTFDINMLRKTDLKSQLKEMGTLVQISSLHPPISKQFKDKSGFVKDLSTELRNHYGYIIQQGFKITLNGEKIDSLELNLLTNDISGIKNKKSITPYVYSSQLDDVDIEVMVGFYRPPASEEEIEKELIGSYAASQSENAGITILCNDRVVLYCDKSHLTGWGEPPVPKYHTQFIAIAGVVHFRSNKPINLPVTTTKRGLDTSSAIYAASKIKIKEGLKYFTAFTNDWKAPSEERTLLFKSIKKINALQPGQSKNSLIKLSTRKGDLAKYQIPNLPKPERIITSNTVNITFTREKDKVEEIRNYFLKSQPKSPNEIGGWCFDTIYSQID